MSNLTREEKKNPFWDNLDPTNWIADSRAKSCFKCNHEFTFTRRKHHCRKCGMIFCHDCVSRRTIAESTNRICNICQSEYD